MAFVPGRDSGGGSDGSVVARVRAGHNQRERIVGAMVEVVAEQGYRGASVGAVITRAGVSRRTFYRHFEGLQDCFAAVLEHGSELVKELVRAAYVGQERWQDAVRWALASLLVFLDSKPQLAQVWLVESHAAGAWTLKYRELKMAELLEVIVEPWPFPDSWRPPPMAVEGAFASVRTIVDNQMLADNGRPLIELLGPLMGLATAPYLSVKEVAHEVECGEQLTRAIFSGEVSLPPLARAGVSSSASHGATMPAMLRNPNAHRARDCLRFVASHPDANNQQIAVGIGIEHKGQVSTLLRRLAGLGLLNKHAQGPGHPTTWRVTQDGQRTVHSLSTSDQKSGLVTENDSTISSSEP
jgi:AcrR family transcriptional regulator